MMWLVLAIFVISVILVLRKNGSQKEIVMQPNHEHEFQAVSANTDVDVEDEYIIAVITAAIHEFTGSEAFEVVKIRPTAQNWTLTGRQNLLINR